MLLASSEWGDSVTIIVNGPGFLLNWNVGHDEF